MVCGSITKIVKYINLSRLPYYTTPSRCFAKNITWAYNEEMSKIQWNTVTWYSKTLALILFVALPFIGFYFGVQYGLIQAPISATSKTTLPPVASTGSNYYSDTAEWQTDANNTKGGFSIAYPIDFDAQDNYAATPAANWSVGATSTGIVFFTLTVPKAFEPQTNFADATLTVGNSKDPTAVAQCVADDQNGGQTVPTSTIAINGTAFTVFQSASAGAGNLYQTTSYRALHNGQCYAIEYTIHSSQIANYPASYNLQPFDQATIDSLMQTIIGTFKFT